MTHTTYTQVLPKGMALIETAEGRWFPALAPLTDTPHWVTILDAGADCIPPALASQPCHDPQKGYSSRKKALEACCAWDEAIRLSVQWNILAAHTEVYPERNAWYLDEIAQMTDGSSTLVTCTIDVTALVIVELRQEVQVMVTVGLTPDEAIEHLYDKVYEWWRAREQESERAYAS
jgi:hypothetical protein